jgi:hypothetical protein
MLGHPAKIGRRTGARLPLREVLEQFLRLGFA